MGCSTLQGHVGAAMGEFTLREMSMNVVHVLRGAVKGALVAWTSISSRRLLVRVLRDEAGSNLVLFAFLMPVMVGVAGLGTEGGLWLYTQQALQGAADSAAISAARAYSITTSANITTQAEAVTASNGFVNGTNGVTVTVNRPPSSGTQTSTQNAIEVTITKSLDPLFSSLWFSTPFKISAVAVAVAPPEQCILALDPSASGAVSVDILAAINLTGCGLFTDSSSSSSILLFFLGFIDATNGTVGTVGNYDDILGFPISPTPTTSDPAISDPYLNINLPPFTAPNPTTNVGCVTGSKVSPAKPYAVTTSTTISTSASAVFCNGISLTGTAANPITVKMNPGIYILYGGSLSMSYATLQSTGSGGVTLVFTGTGANYATASVTNHSTITLTASTTGPTTGMVMYGDRNMPLTQTNAMCTSLFSSGTNFCFDNGSSINPTGAVYLPRANLAFYGFSFNSATNCTQIIVDKLAVWGAAYFADNCSSIGTLSISSVPTLVE
jgi:Flp pilus assembly protein TadG